VTQTDKYALLRDLAQLVRKHGPAVFSELAAFLRNPEAVAELITVLEAAETAGRRARVTESGNAIGGGLPHLFSEIKKGDPAKAQILSGFCGALAAKRALPTLRELRTFAHDNGLRTVNATSRDKAIAPLIRDLAARSLEEIHSLLGRVSMAGTTGDRSLEGWTDVILNKQRSRGGS
jgi:hypothetical protein